MSKEIKGTNPDKESLTLEKLKSFSGCEHLNDEDAKETVFAIQTFATILYEFINEQSKTNQHKIAA